MKIELEIQNFVSCHSFWKTLQTLQNLESLKDKEAEIWAKEINKVFYLALKIPQRFSILLFYYRT